MKINKSRDYLPRKIPTCTCTHTHTHTHTCFCLKFRDFTNTLKLIPIGSRSQAGNSLVVQWLGLRIFTAESGVPSLVRKWRSHKPCDIAKKHPKTKQKKQRSCLKKLWSKTLGKRILVAVRNPEWILIPCHFGLVALRLWTSRPHLLKNRRISQKSSCPIKDRIYN